MSFLFFNTKEDEQGPWSKQVVYNFPQVHPFFGTNAQNALHIVIDHPLPCYPSGFSLFSFNMEVDGVTMCDTFNLIVVYPHIDLI